MGKSKSKPINFYWEFINNSHEDITNSKCYYGTERHHTARVQNLEGLGISANGSTIRQEANVSLFFGCPLYMTVSFSDGSTDEFRISLPSKESVDFATVEGFHHITCDRSSKSKITIKIENSQQQLDEEKAQEKINDGKAAMKQKQYESAIKTFSEALNLANQDSTIKSIEKNKSHACSEFGKECVQQAWDLSRDRFQEARDMLIKAKYLFQEAQTVGKVSYQKDLIIINLMIEGNELFNEANDLEKEALKLFVIEQNDNKISAQNKYEEALVKYDEAVKKFEKGDKFDSRFDDCVKIASEHAENVKNVIGNINSAEATCSISTVNVEE